MDGNGAQMDGEPAYCKNNKFEVEAWRAQNVIGQLGIAKRWGPVWGSFGHAGNRHRPKLLWVRK